MAKYACTVAIWRACKGWREGKRCIKVTIGSNKSLVGVLDHPIVILLPTTLDGVVMCDQNYC